MLAIYKRVSKDEKAEFGVSLANQELRGAENTARAPAAELQENINRERTRDISELLLVNKYSDYNN